MAGADPIRADRTVTIGGVFIGSVVSIGWLVYRLIRETRRHKWDRL